MKYHETRVSGIMKSTNPRHTALILNISVFKIHKNKN